jgi:hypothetical protein
MTQKEILEYYEDNGGLRCGYWSIKEIKDYIKNDMGSNQRVFDSTCRELKRTAQIYQR